MVPLTSYISPCALVSSHPRQGDGEATSYLGTGAELLGPGALPWDRWTR